MKKLFTLAAGALIGLSASLPAEAVDPRDAVYKVGNAITEKTQLTTGKYFIYAYSKGQGAFVRTQGNNLAQKDSQLSLTAGATVNYTYVYDVTVDADGNFTIANCDGVTFPIKGETGLGTGNLRLSIANAQDKVTAKYALSDEQVTGQAESYTGKLFYVTPTNVKFGAVDGDTPTYICTNGNAGDGHFAYYSGTGSVAETDRQFTALAFYPATKVTAEFPIADGKFYYIKNSELNKYLQLESATSGNMAGVSSDTKTVVRIIEGTGDNAGKFAIQNARTNKYFASDTYWNSIYNNDAPYYWFVAMADDTRFVLGQTNNRLNLAGPQGDSNSTIWTDNYIGRFNSDNEQSHDYWELEEVPAYDVTYNYNTQNGNQKLSLTVGLREGTDAATAIPAVQFGSNFALTETNTTVSADNTTFDVTADWNYPIQANTVYRLNLKPSSNGGKVVGVNDAGTEIPTNVTAATTLSTTALWYFKADGYDAAGTPIFTLHSLRHGDAKGVTMENVDAATATMTNTPNRFLLVKCNRNDKQANDFCLKTVGTNCFVNDRGSKFSTWSVGDATAANDPGSVIRPYSLTEDDYTALGSFATPEEIAAAKATPTPELLSPMVSKYQLAQAIAAVEAYGGTVGAGLGQYNNADGDFENKLAEAQALLDDASATVEARAIAADAIAVSNLSINQPVAGHFYRFHYGNKYLSSTLATNDRFSLEIESVDGNNNSNLNNTTVFYYDGSHLVTYPDGLVMGDMVVGAGLKGVNLTDANAAIIRFAASAAVKGKYNIISNGNTRYLYHRSADNERWVDSGNSGASGSTDVGYQWEITEVTWLPIHVDATKKHFSVCVPVDLNIDANRAEAHTGVIQGSNFGLQAIEGTLPANTPAVLEYKGGAAHNCVYFEITGYPEIAPAAEATNDLTNTGVYAAAKEEGQSYFTVDNESFVPAGDTLPAFAAILKVPTDEANAAGYAITEYNPEYVSITEIEGAANNGKQVIYDLQGRRVQRASKGLYIINGVKTLVK